MTRMTIGAVAILTLACVAAQSAQANHVTALALYDVDTNTGTGAGDFINDIAGYANALDAEIQALSTVVVDATRPGSMPGNLVLDTGQVGLGAYSPYDTRLDTGTNGFTLAFWAKHQNGDAFQAVLGRGPFGERVFNQGGKYALAISNGVNADGKFQIADLTPAGLNDGAWHHVAIALDLSNPADPRFVSYLDGAPSMNLAADTGTGNLVDGPITGVGPNDNGMDISGRSFDNGDRFPDAMIDDLAMFSGVLSAQDVSDLFTGNKKLAEFAIPEPTALSLLGVAMLGLLAARRRR